MATMYDLLQSLPVGDGLLIPSRWDLKSRQETFWVLRLTTSEIEWQKANAPDLPIRQCAMLSRGVGLDGKTEVLVAAVLLAVGHDPLDPSRIYRSLLDEHHPVFGHRLEALTTQEMLGVTFIGDSGRVEHTAMVNNVIRPFAQQALAIISRTPPWSPADFIKAGNAFKARYRDRAALWNRLTGQNI